MALPSPGRSPRSRRRSASCASSTRLVRPVASASSIASSPPRWRIGESLLVQKDYLIKEVNHRVQNSLQLVSAFLALQARAEGNAGLSEALSEAQRRLAAVALVHRRLYSDDNVEMIDLAPYLDDLVSEMKSSMGPEWAEQFSTDFAPIIIPTDAAVIIGLILTELVINANKYAYSGAVGPIAISLEQHRNRFRLIVADQGQGMSGTRSGFGTRMLNAMVDRLGGTIENTNNRAWIEGDPDGLHRCARSGIPAMTRTALATGGSEAPLGRTAARRHAGSARGTGTLPRLAPADGDAGRNT